MAADNLVLTTRSAAPERASRCDVAQQAGRLESSMPLLRSVLDAMPHHVMVLNVFRQIVIANRGLLAYVGAEESALQGLRPGEALDCLHMPEALGGCGTGESCSTCGAVIAILNSRADLVDVQECRMSRLGSGDALDFRVWATPLLADSEQYTIVAMLDISHEKRLQALERIFFHDILNTTTAVKALSGMLSRACPDQSPELTGMMARLVDRLIDEIVGQRQLIDAENDELLPNPVPVDIPLLLNYLADLYRHHPVGLGRSIAIDTFPQDISSSGDSSPRDIDFSSDDTRREITFVSDRALLSRVLGNMLKNALEASPPGSVVTIGVRTVGREIEFWVHNPGSMRREVQLQVFQRSFSTKGEGRGLGTYSMKLLSERYLRGTVGFSTDPETGTVVRASYPIKWTGAAAHPR